MKKQKMYHHTHYLFELIALVVGFMLLQAFALSVYAQLFVFAGILVTYFTFGIIHHKIHHNLDAKIVLEYSLLSLLLFAIYVFLNSSRL